MTEPSVTSSIDPDEPGRGSSPGDTSSSLCLVGPGRAASVTGQWLEVINPATSQVIGRIPRCDDQDVAVAVDHAARAAVTWRQTEPIQRAQLLGQFADAIAARADELALLDCLDNGSPLREMRGDVNHAVSQIRYLCGLVLESRGYTLPPSPGRFHFTTRQPFGIVARIIAFNHPLLFLATKLVAPLLAGNVIIMKPSEYSSLSALAMADDLQRIFPPGVVQILTGLGGEVGDALVKHPSIKRIAFIGSVDTGRRIQAAAAAAAVKTVTLELGGKNPIVVFADSDVDLAVDGIVKGMNFTWQSQSCGSTSRLLIHDSCYDQVVSRVSERIAALRTGSPLDPSNDCGSMINSQQLKKVLSYVALGREEGARLVVGGERLTDGALAKGNFVRPALFADVHPDSRLANEEIFGPVLAAIRFTDYDDAIRIANLVDYGLTASVFTRDLQTALSFAHDVEAGYVWVNETSRHFLGAPFGGVKNSGVGREEEVSEIDSYTQTKSVHVKFA